MRRYLETLFRQKELFLIPALAVPLVALLAVALAGPRYDVTASIWVAPSPFSGPSGSSRSAPPSNELEAQALREWLKTESFRREVMDRVGLSSAIQQGRWPVPSQLQLFMRDTGLGSLPLVGAALRAMGLVAPSTKDDAMAHGLRTISSSLKVASDGNNLLLITYSGNEPALGRRLVEEMIVLYNEKTLAVRGEEVRAVTDFYTRQVTLQEERLGQAAQALQGYLAAHPEPPPGTARPPAEAAELENLRRNYVLAQTLYEHALSRLEEVRIETEAAISNRDQSFQVIDVPLEPEMASLSTRSIIMTLLLGLLLGATLGLVPIVVSTWLDGKVRTREDVERAISTPLIAQVPILPGEGADMRGNVRRMLARYPHST